MTLTPRARKIALTGHVTCSVGWLGAVAGFLALSITGLLSDDAATVRGAYLAMEATGWFVLVPLSVASLVTGLVQALGTAWGLFQHYWVVAKLLINVVATVVLVLYMQTLGDLAGVAAASSNGVDALRSPSPALHAGLALLLLVVATVLAVFKPRGLTRYGHRKRGEQRARLAS